MVEKTDNIVITQKQRGSTMTIAKTIEKSEPQTIKREGSAWEATGFVLILAGGAMYSGSVEIGSASILIGFVVFIIGRFK